MRDGAIRDGGARPEKADHVAIELRTVFVFAGFLDRRGQIDMAAGPFAFHGGRQARRVGIELVERRFELVAELRKESEQNAKEIRRVVENGKQRFQDTVAKFARGEQVG